MAIKSIDRIDCSPEFSLHLWSRSMNGKQTPSGTGLNVSSVVSEIM